MPANVDGMVREGISAYRAGRKEEARALLLRAVEIDERNEQAWMWLSAVVESVEEQRTCLENVLTINPNNAQARSGLEMLSQRSGPAVTNRAPSASQADDLLASASFTATPQSPARQIPDEDDELPTSLEWDAGPVTASSSASSQHKVNEPSEAEYDDWVSNLNLGGNRPGSGVADAAAQLSSMSFGDDDEEEEEDDLFSLIDRNAVDDEDDLFADGPFGANETGIPRSMTPPPVSKPAPAKAAASAPRVSPGRNTSKSLLDAIDNDEEFDDTDFLEEDDDEDDLELDKMDASDFFQYIPSEIKATRLPGTNERYPALVILGVVAVLLLNAGAVAFMVMSLTAK